MSPESGSREPDVEIFIAGLDSPNHSDESRRAWCALFLRDIGLLERERFAEALVRAVEELPTWDKRTVPGGLHVNRAAVLAAISALRSPADTGEHQEGDVG